MGNTNTPQTDMADLSHMEHSTEEYAIIGTPEHNSVVNGNLSHNTNDLESKGRADFGAQLRKTERKERTVIRHPDESPDYLSHLKKSDGNVAVKPTTSRGNGKSGSEQKPRMTADELMKIASTAMQEVDDKEKRDMASRRGVGLVKPSSGGTVFEGFKASEDTQKLDFKSVLRKSMRKTSPSSASKKAEDKPEWTQQKRTIKVNEIENRVGKPKGGGEGPEWADKVHKGTARQRMTELEHKKITSHNTSETPEWAGKVPKDTKDILAKTEYRFKGRQNSEERPNYRGVLKNANCGPDRKDSKESSGKESD